MVRSSGRTAAAKVLLRRATLPGSMGGEPTDEKVSALGDSKTSEVVKGPGDCKSHAIPPF